MKRIIISACVSFALLLEGLVINLLCYFKQGYLPLAYHMYGGEITSEAGFGLRHVHIYSMLPNSSDSRSLRFAPLNFILTWLVLFVGVWLIITLIGLIAKKRAK